MDPFDHMDICWGTNSKNHHFRGDISPKAVTCNFAFLSLDFWPNHCSYVYPPNTMSLRISAISSRLSLVGSSFGSFGRPWRAFHPSYLEQSIVWWYKMFYFIHKYLSSANGIKKYPLTFHEPYLSLDIFLSKNWRSSFSTAILNQQLKRLY